MSEKLTCKMSDGREWSVVGEFPATDGSENRVVWLVPIPRKPREAWIELLNGEIVSAHSYEAGKVPTRQYAVGFGSFVHMREVIDE